MINVKTLTLGFMAVNCYVVRREESRECVVIDPGDRFSKIKKYIDETGLSVRGILLTHGHFDHIGACAALREETGAKVYIHALDADKLADPQKSLAAYSMAKCPPFEADVLLKGGEELDLAGMRIEVLHTPGHSAGGATYFIEESAFCGDTLFYGSFGRYDFYDGDLSALVSSVQNILAREGEFDIYPGHGQKSSASFERAQNPLRKR